MKRRTEYRFSFCFMKGVGIMAYIKPEIMKKIKQVDLLTYLLNYQPERLKKISHDTYCIRDHDSLHISNGLWHWQSMGIGGKSALDFLIKVDNYSFLDAAEIIANQLALKEPEYVPYSEKEKDKQLQKPLISKDNSAVIDYLLSRGIAYDIIHYCISHYMILQTVYNNPETGKTYSNVAFIGYDKETQKARHIALRGINSDFIGDATGSDKRFSFYIESVDPDCNIVHVNEAPIDALSQATLFTLDGKSFNQEHILALTGAYAPRNETKEIKIPIALVQFLKDHPKVDTIIFHLDLDRTGRMATKLIIENMKVKMSNYKCLDEPPKHYKDTNDSLCTRLGIQPVKKRKKIDWKHQER